MPVWEQINYSKWRSNSMNLKEILLFFKIGENPEK